MGIEKMNNDFENIEGIENTESANNLYLYGCTKHCLKRAKQRMGLNEKKALRVIDNARKRGIKSSECHWSSDRHFLERKSGEDVCAIAYNGFCFIMERENLCCITVIELPKYFGRKKMYYRKKAKEE